MVDLLGLIWFILAAYGLTQILVYGTIFDAVRPTKGKLGELFRCPMCMGFWVGAFLWGINKYTELFIFEFKLCVIWHIVYTQYDYWGLWVKNRTN